MAEISHTTTKLGRGAYQITWAGVGNADTFQPWTPDGGCPVLTDKSAQVLGTFGGTTVTIQGGNNGISYVTLNNPANEALSFTAAGLEAILENTGYIKPLMTGGTGSSITVVLVARGILQLR